MGTNPYAMILAAMGTNPDAMIHTAMGTNPYAIKFKYKDDCMFILQVHPTRCLQVHIYYKMHTSSYYKMFTRFHMLRCVQVTLQGDTY